MNIAEVKQAKAAHARALLRKPGVVAVGVLDPDRRVVGLLFAGGAGLTVFNRFANVAELLGVGV